MENSITMNVSTVQLALALAFQIWIIIFPIIIIRKLNYLTALLQAHFETDNESAD